MRGEEEGFGFLYGVFFSRPAVTMHMSKLSNTTPAQDKSLLGNASNTCERVQKSAHQGCSTPTSRAASPAAPDAENVIEIHVGDVGGAKKKRLHPPSLDL